MANINYDRMEEFFDLIKRFAVYNPDREITSQFVYSNLIRFGVKAEDSYQYIDHYFPLLLSRYQDNPNIHSYLASNNYFLVFANGKLQGNEIKIYVPLDKNHVLNGVAKIMDFLSKTNIAHQSKLSRIIRNDDVVIRVNTIEDANRIINFIKSDIYIQEGMLEVNPFLPNMDGLGMAMDNNYSYNLTVAESISNYLTLLRMQNRLDDFNVKGYNNYLKQLQAIERDLDLKDIYSLLSKTTTKSFAFKDFREHATDKMASKYTEDRVRITDPTYYFEKAILDTYLLYPQNPKTAILEFMKGNAQYFTNKQYERAGLIKYVSPILIQNIMASKLTMYGYKVPNKLEELIDIYLSIILERDRSITEEMEDENSLFNILKSAYVSTKKVYNEAQAKYALKRLLVDGNAQAFTNRFGDRKRLKEHILGYNIRDVILSGVDKTNLDINNVDEVIERFSQSIYERVQ